MKLETHKEDIKLVEQSKAVSYTHLDVYKRQEHISDKTEAERIAGACENGQALVTSVVKEEK